VKIQPQWAVTTGKQTNKKITLVIRLKVISNEIENVGKIIEQSF
jgi:hypothetical protein